MKKIKRQEKIDKIYCVVVSDMENKLFPSFKEAETYAKDTCDVTGEEVQMFEIVRAWTIYYPSDPEPESMEVKLELLVD